MAGRYCEGKIKMASEKVSRKMVLEIKYVNANNAVIHTENSKLLLDLNCSPKELVTGILAKISLGTGPGFRPNLGWELGFGTPLHDPPRYYVLSIYVVELQSSTNVFAHLAIYLSVNLPVRPLCVLCHIRDKHHEDSIGSKLGFSWE